MSLCETDMRHLRYWCLYFLISNRLPYEATQSAAQISLILNKPPTPITEHIPELPGDLVVILSKALSRAPGDRYRSAEALRKALLPFASRR